MKNNILIVEQTFIENRMDSNILLYVRRLNCNRASKPSINHCMFSILTAACGSIFQMKRKRKAGLETEQDGVTKFVHGPMDTEIPFQLNNSTGGVIKVRSPPCPCSLCLFDPSHFLCHCSTCLPSHAFTNIPDRRHCPYVHIRDEFRTYVDGRLIQNGWKYQLQQIEGKCCCLFHPCPTNDEPCLCKNCVLDFFCDCTTCGGQCGECGSSCDVNSARSEIECKHKKCEDFSVDKFWADIKKGPSEE